MAQSNAINRYLARKFGLAGKNEWESALLDSYADFHQEVYVAFKPYIYRKLNFEPYVGEDHVSRDFSDPRIKFGTQKTIY